MEKVTFTTRKPNIIDRIKGYFQRRRYMRQWKREQAERYAAYTVENLLILGRAKQCGLTPY